MAKHALPKIYDFKSTEERIYKMWEDNGYFSPWNDPRNEDFDPSIKPFVISIPPRMLPESFIWVTLCLSQ